MEPAVELVIPVSINSSTEFTLFKLSGEKNLFTDLPFYADLNLFCKGIYP
jgi:hypothetical protein